MAIIITDSSSDLSIEQAKKLNVEMICMSVHFADKSYLDKKELTNEEFYKRLTESEEIPTTTLLNPNDYIEVFEKYPNDDIIVITLASALSGTFQSANIARDMAERENIYIVDSQSVAAAQGLLVRQAVKWNEEGMEASQIAEKLTALSDRVVVMAIMDTLKYVVKGGRLSAVEGAVGTVLNLKPILCIDKGKILTLNKCRGIKAAKRELIRIINEDIKIDTDYEIAYVHGNAEDVLNTFIEEAGYVGDSYTIGTVVGTHVGPGAVGLAYIKK